MLTLSRNNNNGVVVALVGTVAIVEAESGLKTHILTPRPVLFPNLPIGVLCLSLSCVVVIRCVAQDLQ